MATITFLEAGTDATFDLAWYTVISGAGNITSDAVTPHTGPRSLKVVSDAGANNPTVSTQTGVVTDAGSRWSVYVRFATFPAVTTDFFQITNAGFGKLYALQITAAGVLGLSVAGIVKSGSTLSTGTWYRLSVAHVITSAVSYTIKVFVNAVLDASATEADGALLAITGTQFVFGFFTATGSGSYNLDDLYADNGATLDDPGNILVTAKLPASVNTGAFDTTVGNGAVNERALSETNGMEDTTVNGDQQNYTLQTAAVGDVDLTGLTLVGRSAWIWAKITVASVLAKLMDNGSESAVTLTAASALYTVLTTSATYPSNAAGIGMRSSTTPNTFLYECGTLLAYLAASAAAVGDVYVPVFRRRRR